MTPVCTNAELPQELSMVARRLVSDLDVSMREERSWGEGRCEITLNGRNNMSFNRIKVKKV